MHNGSALSEMHSQININTFMRCVYVKDLINSLDKKVKHHAIKIKECTKMTSIAESSLLFRICLEGHSSNMDYPQLIFVNL